MKEIEYKDKHECLSLLIYKIFDKIGRRQGTLQVTWTCAWELLREKKSGSTPVVGKNKMSEDKRMREKHLPPQTTVKEKKLKKFGEKKKHVGNVFLKLDKHGRKMLELRNI